jgi:hypothetical protein
MLGLFDRPADEKAVGALLKSPAIPGLTESLTDLGPTEWRTILAKLRRMTFAVVRCLRSGMRIVVRLFQTFDGDVCINLRG